MKKKFWLEGHPIWVKELFINEHAYKARIKYEKPTDICPLCRKEILPEGYVYTLNSNYKLFPGVSVHKECVKQEWHIIIKQLRKDWIAAKENEEHNRCWYGWRG